MVKTTASNFQLYKKLCLKWHNKLGLHDWTPGFKHDAEEDSRAEVWYNFTNNSCTYCLSKEWIEKPTTTDVDSVALHEALHVLFLDLYELIVDTSLGLDNKKKAATRVEHKIINRLSKLILKE